MSRVPVFGGTLDTEAPLSDENLEDQDLMMMVEALVLMKAEEEGIEKSGVLSGTFGNRKKRQAQLVRRLKRRRKYGLPVKGGKKKKTAAGSLTGLKSKRTRRTLKP